MQTINSAPLYSYIGYLLDQAQKNGKHVHATLTAPNGTIEFDGDIIKQDGVDGIYIKNQGKYNCEAITRDIVWGYKFVISVQ